MEYKQKCPLTRSECEKTCGWYVVGLNVCAVNSVAQALDVLLDAIEEKMNEE